MTEKGKSALWRFIITVVTAAVTALTTVFGVNG
jgi:hypothetical protein